MNARLLIILCFILLSCQSTDDEVLRELTGEWQWIESQGGLAGWTLTPMTEGYHQSLIINDIVFQMYQDDSLTVESSYILDTYNYPLFDNGDSTIIQLDNNMTWGITWEADSLYLLDLCTDCYLHTYLRR